jgi:hypothetical protein
MFAVRTSQFPAPGKLAELREYMTDSVRKRHEAGLRANLTQTTWGPDNPALHFGTQFADLGAVQEFAEGPFGQTVVPPELYRQWRTTVLSEIVIAPPAGPPGAFVQRVIHRPLPGRVGALRALLADRATTRNANGERCGLMVGIAGEAASALVLNVVVGSLAELQASRTGQSEDPDFAGFIARTSDCLAQPVTVEIQRVLVPFPQQ